MIKSGLVTAFLFAGARADFLSNGAPAAAGRRSVPHSPPATP